MKDAKTYDKARSILEIRAGEDGDVRKIWHDIRALQQFLDKAERPLSYKKRIVLRACNALLSSRDSVPGGEFFLQDHVMEEIARISCREHLLRYLFYRYRYEVYPKTRQLDDFPPCLQIEASSICNYRCVFCYQMDREFTNPKNGHMGCMDLQLFQTIVDEAEGNCEAVTLASRGEPTIAKDFPAMLAYLKGKFLALKINTNAWFLDEDMAHAILDAGVNTVVFSADAASEPLYSRLRVRGNLERVMANIRMFHEIRRRHYPDAATITRVSGVKCSDEQDLDDMEAAWGALVDQVVFVRYQPWENTYARPLNDVRDHCSDLWRRMFVWHDGSVNPCDVDFKSTLHVGKVGGMSLKEIWRGPSYTDLRARHTSGQRASVTPCNRCTFL